MWAEEGLTQMMEEHVTRVATFMFGHDMLKRLARCGRTSVWIFCFAEGSPFSPRRSGRAGVFHTPRGSADALAALVGRKDFFAFARACRNERHNPAEAAREYLGGIVQELAERLIWGAG